jgi:hypothetical protein
MFYAPSAMTLTSFEGDNLWTLYWLRDRTKASKLFVGGFDPRQD